MGKNKKSDKKFSFDAYYSKILNFLTLRGKKPMPFKELEQKCRGSKKRNNFDLALNSLIESGTICETKKGFVNSAQMGYFKAKITRLNGSFGFMERMSNKESIFVPGKFLCGAIPDDIVLAGYIKSHSDNPEGEVLKILKPAESNIAGTIVDEYGQKYFCADSMTKIPIKIIKSDVELNIGDKVLAQLVSRGERHHDHKVKIIMNFGSSMNASSCAAAIIAEKGVSDKFPENVIHEAKKIAAAGIWEDDFKGRLDLRDKIIFTIDSEESKDLDDAVSLERSENGNGYQLGVHIADVSHYVRPNSPLDSEALERGTSIYYADKVIPMLPKQLSNGICSLNLNENRLTFSVIMNLSENGELENFKFVKSVIRSRVKGIYSEINQILDGSADDRIKTKYDGLEDTIRLMDGLADILIENRKKRGAPSIETVESSIVVENDKCVNVKERTRGKSEMIIEVFMLAANEAAARFAREREFPFVYRVHEPPSEKRITELKEGLRRLNVDIPVFSKMASAHAAGIIENAKDKPIYPIINMMVLRSMAKARYEENPKGHFGLALEDYSHFTSPIRRYPDLAIHRILSDAIYGADKEWLEKRYTDFAHKASLHSTEAEIRAMNIERDCSSCYKAEYMQQHLGEIFTGIISSVTEFGFYVQLANTIEGLVHINSLPEGNYIYDGFFTISDQYGSRTFTIGDRISVLCAGSDVNSGNINFEITDNKE